MSRRQSSNGSNGYSNWQPVIAILNVVVSVLLAVLGWLFVEMNRTLSEVNDSVTTLKANTERNRDEINKAEAKLEDLIKKYYELSGSRK